MRLVTSVLTLVLISAVVLHPAASAADPDSSRATAAFAAPFTPDALIDNLARALEQRRADEYEILVDDSFVFDFAPDAAWLAPPDGRWSVDREIEAMRNLLSGERGAHDRSPLVSLAVDFSPLDGWDRLHGPHSETMVEVWARDYSARMTLRFADDSVTHIHRRHRFTVAAPLSEATMRSGEFRLVRWEEHEALGGFGVVRFGGGCVKSRFDEPTPVEPEEGLRETNTTGDDATRSSRDTSATPPPSPVKRGHGG